MRAFIRQGENQLGPFPIEQIRQYVTVEQIRPSDMACVEGSTIWQSVEMLLNMPSSPPPVTAIQSIIPSARNKRQDVLKLLGCAAIVGIFFPWSTATGPGGSITKDGWSVSGSVLIGILLIGMFPSAYIKVRGWQKWLFVIATIIPILTIAIIQHQIQSAAEQAGVSLTTSFGLGLWLTLISSACATWIAFQEDKSTGANANFSTAETRENVSHTPAILDVPNARTDRQTVTNANRDTIWGIIVLVAIVAGVGWCAMNMNGTNRGRTSTSQSSQYAWDGNFQGYGTSGRIELTARGSNIRFAIDPTVDLRGMVCDGVQEPSSDGAFSGNIPMACSEGTQNVSPTMHPSPYLTFDPRADAWSAVPNNGEPVLLRRVSR